MKNPQKETRAAKSPVIRILLWLDEKAEEQISICSLAIITAVMTLQVFCRYVLGNSLSWSEELCRYLLIWWGMLSLSYCIKKRNSIRVEMIKNLLPKRIQYLLSILENLIMIVFCLYMCIPSWKFLLTVIHNGQTSPAMNIPLFLIQSSPLAAFFLGALRSFQNLIIEIKAGCKTKDMGSLEDKAERRDGQ